MNVLLLGNKTIHKLKLPSRVEGSFFLTDPITGEKIIIIESLNGKWNLYSSSDAVIVDKNNTLVEKTFVNNNEYYFVENGDKKNIIYFQKVYDDSFKMYKIKSDCNFIIGSGETANLKYLNSYIKPEHMILNFEKGEWVLKTKPDCFVYVNDGIVLKEEKKLNNGDIIFTYGLKIVLANGFLFVNNPNELLTVNTPNLNAVSINEVDVPYEEVKEVDYYKDGDYYFTTPRIRRFIETYELAIANPPGKQNMEEMPLLLTLGPMLTMALMSVITAVNAISAIVSGETTLAKGWMRLISPVMMLVSALLWPNITRKWRKKQKIKKEEQRKEKYLTYLEEKRQEIIKETVNQTNILRENYLLLKDCYETIITKRRTLWEKKISQRDFLSVRVGIGDIPIDMNIKFSEDDFVIEKDVLKEVANKMVDEAKMLHNVPINFSFFRKQAVAVMGKENLVRPFMDNILLQMLAYHSYDELKIVVFTNEDNKSFWDIYKDLPHMFSNDKSVRFYSYENDSNKELSAYLEQEFINRAMNTKEAEVEENESEDEDTRQKESYIPHYLIITDDYMKIRKLGICDLVFDNKEDFGFTFVIMDSRLSRLPSSCTNFIMLDKPMSSILRNDGDNYHQQVFYDEIDDSFDMNKCVASLANIPIEFEQDLRYLPTSLGFLEMYNVGKVEQLNVFNRWKLNDPTQSLRAPLGINDQSNLIYLDLHEKFHGPHGLIAGTTGSGKSEFIITYILSMAVNYSPNEVSFILIDYKGGGLAGAFENKKNNVRLPHLAGTITNLDKNELNRTLVSIQSELKRRQSVFNEARDFLGESTIDIYKYQKFFREGRLKNPMPHLFIICDEFAELKAQQPEFMDNLISAARIGRSLGVHLILATQKPSGVVNDQIWSNTKFRVCLKVAEKGDSNEVIKRPDAAEIKNAGRFYLQVGYNELFVLGQSGWCGAPYIPSDVMRKEYDRSISFIDDNGRVIKNLSEENLGTKKKVSSNGDELSNILKYVTNIANKENIRADSLWLESMPGEIYLQDVIEKYEFHSDEPTAVIGEYDDPSTQYQNILTVPLNSEGNTIVFGLTGNNREMFIRALVYSASSLYSSEDVNFYIFDFGSETFKVFNNLPHVGEVVFSNETDKVDKLLKLIDEEIILRKKLFVEYNGDYANYCKNSGKKLPLYVVVITNYDSFKELYMNYEEFVIKLCRDGKRYGIIFVIAASSRFGLFSRFLKNFDNTFVLDMNSKEEYMDILGRIGDVYPADHVGRGLFKEERAFEFQTAKICDDINLVEFIKNKGRELQATNSYKAKAVPVLPEVVTLESMKEFITPNLKEVPIGLVKETLKPYLYDFKAYKGTIISSNELEQCHDVIRTLLDLFRNVGNIVTVLFDFNSIFEDLKGYANSYCHNGFEEFLEQIFLFAKNKIMGTKFTIVLLIAGVDKYKEIIPQAKIDEINRMLKKLPNSQIIFIDGAFRMKKMLYETWFTEVVSNNNGIWIGNGVSDQTVIRATDFERVHNSQLPKDFAWVFKNGKTELVKLINCEAKDEE